MNSIKIEIPSISENIRLVESFIDNVKDKYELNDDIYGNMMIAVIESVNNAILHGNGGDMNKNVSLSLQMDSDTVKVIVKDQGPGFNHHDLPDPTAPENLNKPSGRGIFLMRNLCDEVNFRNDGAEVEMCFYLN